MNGALGWQAGIEYKRCHLSYAKVIRGECFSTDQPPFRGSGVAASEALQELIRDYPMFATTSILPTFIMIWKAQFAQKSVFFPENKVKR